MVSDQSITRQDLVRYLQVHRPEKVDRADRILATYEGRHSQLRQELFDKYGAEVGGDVQVAGGGWHATRQPQADTSGASITHQITEPSDAPIMSMGADSVLDSPPNRPMEKQTGFEPSQQSEKSSSWKMPWQSNTSSPTKVPLPASGTEDEGAPNDAVINMSDAEVLEKNHEWVDKLGGLYATGVTTNRYEEDSLQMRKCYFTFALFIVLLCMVGVVWYALSQAGTGA
jgi:hypothetical protein